MASPDVFDSIFGGGFQLPSSGLLGEDDSKQLRNNALLSAGLGVAGGEGGLVPALQQGLQAGQQSYQQGVGTALQLNQFNRQQIIEMKRAEIFRNNPPPQNPTMDEAHQYLSQILPQLVQVGDTETVRSVVELLKSVQQQKTKNPQSVDLGDRVVLRDPETGEIVYESKKGAAPRDTAAGTEQREEMTRQRSFQREQQLATRFEAATKDYSDIARLAQVVYSSAGSPSAAGDLSLIFAYMKLLDPGSVVREGEFATAANTGSVPESVWGRYNRILKGERLAPPVRADFVDRAGKLVTGYRGRLKHIMNQYERRAKNANVDPSMVVYDYFEGMDAPGAAAKPPLSQILGTGR